MACLFLVAGISARYSFEHRTYGEFLRERVKRLLVPSIAGIFLLGWINGYVTSQYTDMFAGNGEQIPGIIKYFIYSLCGIGPLWFAHELFLASVILVIIRMIDKKDTLWKICGKANFLMVLLLFFAVWGSAQVLNTPIITVYRHGIYIFLFLLGYFLFSHDSIQNMLVRYHIVLGIAALTCGIGYTIHYFGTNYTDAVCLQGFFTNLYAWLMILAILGWAKARYDKKTKFVEYLNPRNFGIYVLHYPIMTLLAYWITTNLSLPMIFVYPVLLATEILTVPILYEIVSRVPIVCFLLLGKPWKNEKEKPLG